MGAIASLSSIVSLAKAKVKDTIGNRHLLGYLLAAVSIRLYEWVSTSSIWYLKNEIGGTHSHVCGWLCVTFNAEVFDCQCQSNPLENEKSQPDMIWICKTCAKIKLDGNQTFFEKVPSLEVREVHRYLNNRPGIFRASGGGLLDHPWAPHHPLSVPPTEELQGVNS